MNIDWDLIVKIVPVISVIIGGLYILWKYLIERKERLLDKDFEKIDKLLTDENFKRKMRKNHLLRAVYYKNINYFNGIKNEVIDVVIKTQNRENNFNGVFYDINGFYKSDLVKINSKKDGFYFNKANDENWKYQSCFIWIIWTTYIGFLFLVAIFLSLLFGGNIKIPVILILFVVMACFQFPIMERQQLISDWKKFKRNSKHLLDNANEIP